MAEHQTKRAGAFLTMLLAVACSEVPIDFRDVPGTYVMNHGRAADTLFVQAHGRYRRIYAMPGENIAVDSGTWSVDSIYDVDRKRFHVLAAFAAFPRRWLAETEAALVRRSPRFLLPESWPAVPERTLTGRIQFVVDPDLEWSYVRRR
jgi:hypothetical protein